MNIQLCILITLAFIFLALPAKGAFIYVEDSLNEVGKVEVDTGETEPNLPFIKYSFIEQVAKTSYITGTRTAFGENQSNQVQVNVSAWVYSNGSSTRIGVYGDEHINPISGSNEIYTLAINSNGLVAGGSNRWHPDGSMSGATAWVADEHGTTLIPRQSIGLDIPLDSDFPFVTDINNSGHVIGNTSYLFSNGSVSNQAWLFKDGTLHILGLSGPEYAALDGTSTSRSTFINENGQVAGNTHRYVGNDFNGTHAWIFNNGQYTQLGYTDAEHTDENGFQYSTILSQNENGDVVGQSYLGVGSGGNTLWSHQDDETIKIGLFDSDHTRSDGFRRGFSYILTESGISGGNSTRYNGMDENGSSAWLFKDGITINIGLLDDYHTSSKNRRRSSVQFINEAGQAVGDSAIYRQGDAYLGSTLWLYSEGEHVLLGLKDEEHTHINGESFSSAYFFNEAGQVAGDSARYSSDGDSAGYSAWQYSEGVTTKIGIYDGEYTRDSDGRQNSSVLGQNEAGQVIGYSTNYSSNSDTAWFYDNTTMLLYTFDLDAGYDTSFNSYFYGITNDGFAYGIYNDGDFEQAFGFTVELGYFLISDFLGDDFQEMGWTSVKAIQGITEDGLMYGIAITDDAKRALFAASIRESRSSSQVVEPSTISIFILSILFTYQFRYFKSKRTC
ncbi:hypothetical protein [Thalassotalea litorea]|uniref:hypothetical protein n=1 Tax=Thalassotalea litorea TaxID=2020715 RepID=UPI0037354022